MSRKSSNYHSYGVMLPEEYKSPNYSSINEFIHPDNISKLTYFIINGTIRDDDINKECSKLSKIGEHANATDKKLISHIIAIFHKYLSNINSIKPVYDESAYSFGSRRDKIKDELVTELRKLKPIPISRAKKMSNNRGNHPNETLETIISTIPKIVQKINNSTMSIKDIKEEIKKLTALSFDYSDHNKKKIIADISKIYNIYIITIEKLNINTFNNNNSSNSKTTSAKKKLIDALENIYENNKYTRSPPPPPSPSPQPPSTRKSSLKKPNFLNNILGNPMGKLKRASSRGSLTKKNKGLNISQITKGPSALLHPSKHNITHQQPEMSELEKKLARRKGMIE
jgi:hypothetical protein